MYISVIYVYLSVIYINCMYVYFFSFLFCSFSFPSVFLNFYSNLSSVRIIERESPIFFFSNYILSFYESSHISHGYVSIIFFLYPSRQPDRTVSYFRAAFRRKKTLPMEYSLHFILNIICTEKRYIYTIYTISTYHWNAVCKSFVEEESLESRHLSSKKTLKKKKKSFPAETVRYKQNGGGGGERYSKVLNNFNSILRTLPITYSTKDLDKNRRKI